MELFIHAYYPVKSAGIKRVKLFGHTTNGIPGLEIVGMRRGSRALKEKLVFFSKRLHLHFPLKRFVLCIEEEPEILGDISFLEFPLFFLWLNLAEIIRIKNLESCICSGRLLLTGEILCLNSKSVSSSFFRADDTLLVPINNIDLSSGRRGLAIEDIFREQGLLLRVILSDGQGPN